MECSKCGVSEEILMLHDVITSEGIVKLCKKCISEENAPIIKRPSEKEINSVVKNESLYKRLSDSAGLNPVEHRKNIQEPIIFSRRGQTRDEISLRDLVDKKFDRIGIKKENNKREDLIDNFHWVIMRARRAKKKTTFQISQEIQEPERAIKLAEQGVLPEGYAFVRKLEANLGIRILKPEIEAELDRQKKQLGFDKHSTENITLADLNEMKKENFLPIKEPYWRRVLSRIMGKQKEEDINEDDFKEERNDDLGEIGIQESSVEINNTGVEIESTLPKENRQAKRDLSEDDINDIIFGRK